MSRIEDVRAHGAELLTYARAEAMRGGDPIAIGSRVRREAMASIFAEAGHVPSERLQTLVLTEMNFGMRWAGSGAPCIRPTGKLAASFAATSLPPSALAGFLVPPWPTFAVQVPDNLLSGTRHAVSWLAVMVEDDGRWAIGLGANGQFGFIGTDVCDSTGELGDRVDDADDKTGLGRDEIDGFFRTMTLARRIVAGCCIELLNRRSSTVREERQAGDRRSSADPGRWVFRLTRDVRVDMREGVRSWASGRSGRLAVQSLVRGHWKNQPHGPRNSLRKWIHVEPFWRGPEDAPIAVRSHVMKAAEQAIASVGRRGT